MRRIMVKLSLFFYGWLLLTSPVLVQAQNNTSYYGLEETAQSARYKDSGQNLSLARMVTRVVSIFLALLAVLFFGLVFYAGVRWLTAQGNEDHVTKAKNTLEAAVAGLIVILAAYAITNYIFDKLNRRVQTPTTAPTIPPGGIDCFPLDLPECRANSAKCLWNDNNTACEPLPQ